jgi:hypothetical protein
MVRTPAVALAMAALVVLAGCGGVLDSGAGPADGTTTVSVDPGSLPDGVTEDGITNTSQLAQSHAAGLSETGFSASYELIVTLQTPQGTREQEISQMVRASSGMTHFFVNATNAQGTQSANTQYWGNDSIGLTRNQVGNQTTFQKLPDSLDRANRFTLAASLSQLLNVGDYGITATESVDGETRFTLSANSVNSSFGSGSPGGIDASNVSNVSSSVVVDESGIIHAFDLSFNASAASGNAQYKVSFEVTGTSDVSISSPSWIGDALANVTDANLSASFTDGIVSISHQGGDPVPSTSQLIVQANGSIYQGTVERSIEAGQTVYLSLNRSAGSVAVVDNESAASQMTGPIVLQLYTQDQQVLLQTQLNASDGDGN